MSWAAYSLGGMQVAIYGGAAAVVGGIQVNLPAIPLAIVVPVVFDATGAIAGIWLMSTPAEFEQALGALGTGAAFADNAKLTDHFTRHGGDF